MDDAAPATMNGAEAALRTLHAGGVDVCFANPGTSEMQFVDALDRTGLMRCVLGLQENVVTGAADGYARMAGRPAVSLLHLAAGFANGAANLHNARKARTPMLTLVGDHAIRHLDHDAPLTADVAGATRPFAEWTRTAQSAATLGADAAAALAACLARGGQGAALISPADIGWDAGGAVAAPVAPLGRDPVDPAAVAAAARALGPDALLYVGGSALEDGATLALIEGIARATGAAVLAPTSNRRIERGAGGAPIRKIPYFVDLALETLARFRACVLVETTPPVGFFAYPGRPSLMLPPGCATVTLAGPRGDGRAAVAMLADRLRARPVTVDPGARPAAPQAGPITPEALAAALAHALPEGAIVIDEGITAARAVFDACAPCPRNSWLALTGGAIGGGPPMALGAAIACPDRPVIAVQADGSAMYTFQALWSQARENANVTTVILANRGYEILKGELMRVGANPGPSALNLLEMTGPEVDFVQLAAGMGVEGLRVDDAARLAREIAAAAARPGPCLIEARIA